MQHRFRSRRELRALHADVGAALVDRRIARRERGHDHESRQHRTDRIGQADVCDHAVSEERARSPVRAVDELVGNDDVPGAKLLLQTADRPDGEQKLGAELLQRAHVGAKVDLARKDAMTTAVARQEGDADATQLAHDERIRGRAERRAHRDLLRAVEPGHLIEPAPADHAEAHGRRARLPACRASPLGDCHSRDHLGDAAERCNRMGTFLDLRNFAQPGAAFGAKFRR